MKPVPEAIRALVSSKRVALSLKAARRLFEDGFSFDDLLESILAGVVTKKVKDETKVARYKYVIEGPSPSGRTIYSCGKVVASQERSSYFVLTAHEAED